jgi:hypothetical protein
MADASSQVIPDSLPLPLDEETDTMAKMTVAQLHAKHEALAVQVTNLSDALTEALDVVESQGQALANMELEVVRAHARLDKARDVIQGLKGNTTRQANTQARKSRPAPTPSDRRHTCTVPNAHDEETTHTTTELNACWQSFYAAKANA